MIVSTVRQDLMSDGSEFQVRGAATENAACFAFLGQSAAGRRMNRLDQVTQVRWR